MATMIFSVSIVFLEFLVFFGTQFLCLICQLEILLSTILRENNPFLEIVTIISQKILLSSLSGIEGTWENFESIDSSFARYADVHATIVLKLEILSFFMNILHAAAHYRKNCESWFIFDYTLICVEDRGAGGYFRRGIPTGRKCVRIHRAVPCLLRLIGICIVNA